MRVVSKKRRVLNVAPRGGAADAGWNELRSGELRILQAAALAKLPWLVHGFSTRAGGASCLNGQAALNLGFTDWDSRENVLDNRASLLTALRAEKMKLVTLRQVHSDIVHLFEATAEPGRKGDASITSAPGIL